MKSALGESDRMMRIVLRISLGVCALLFGVVLAPSRALAVVEYCPATVASATALDTTGDSSLFALRFSGESARTVSGVIHVEAGDRWYRASFANATIEPHDFHYKTSSIEFVRHQYVSDVVYLKFPNAVSFQSTLVTGAVATNDSVFDWGSQPRDCAPVMSNVRPPSQKSAEAELPTDPLPSPAPPSARDKVLVMASEAAPGDTSCATPFKEATPVHVVQPRWPTGVRIVTDVTTLVKVAISATGSVDDAWTYRPSGVADLDDAAVTAAKFSQYLPKIAFCKPVPGMYIFHSDFTTR